MDYEFWFEGRKPVARLPMEQQAIGRWLTDEIGNNRQQINTLITNVEQLLAGGLSEYRWQGRETLLVLNRDEAEVIAHALLQDDDLSLDDSSLNEPELDLHDSDQRGGCGLEDFHALLHAWQAFISG